MTSDLQLPGSRPHARSSDGPWGPRVRWETERRGLVRFSFSCGVRAAFATAEWCANGAVVPYWPRIHRVQLCQTVFKQDELRRGRVIRDFLVTRRSDSCAGYARGEIPVIVRFRAVVLRCPMALALRPD